MVDSRMLLLFAFSLALLGGAANAQISNPQTLNLYNVSSSGTLHVSQLSSSNNLFSYYPYELTANAYTGVTYTLTQTLGGATTTLFSSVNSFTYLPPSNQVSVLASNTACVGNYAGGNPCLGSVTYTSNTVLSGNIIVTKDIFVDSGVQLTTNGFMLIAGNMIDNAGTIYAGNIPNSGSAGAGVPGESFFDSYGGSGGGGGSTGGTAAGAGSTPSAPALTNAEIATLTSNVLNYMSGAGGGYGYNTAGGSTLAAGGTSGSGGTGGVGNGGNGAYGIYLQANDLIAGVINANGQSASSGYGGGGGGGVVILAYRSSNYAAGTYNVSGGAGATNGGTGGAGQVVTYSYTAQPLINLPYIYTLTESEGTGQLTIPLNLTVNMTDIKNAFTFNSYSGACIQYLPCLATIASGSYASEPSSIKIVPAGTPTGNQHTSGNVLQAQFDSANLTVAFANSITLTYNQFPSAISFTPNALDNPLVQSSITQSKMAVIATNTTATGLYTRLIANSISYDQQFFTSLYSNTSYGATMLLNNYTFTVSNVFSANSYQLYMPESSYQNPIIYLSGITSLSSAASHFTMANNYCPVVLSNSAHATFQPYLVNSNGTLYSFGIYTSSGGAPTNYYMTVQEAHNGSYAQVGQIQLSQSSFSYPLEQTGALYKFLIENPDCTSVIYTQGPYVPPSSIQMILPQSTNVSVLRIANANVTCKTVSTGANTEEANCTGMDAENIVSGWTIDFYNSSTIFSILTSLQNTSITGASFTWNSIPVATSGNYKAVFYARTGISQLPVAKIFSYPLNGYGYVSPYLAGGSILAVLVVFLFAFMGAEMSQTLTFAFIDLGLLLIAMLNIVPLPGAMFYSVILVSAILIVLMETGRIG